MGAKLPSLGLGAWYGEAVRFVMVIGTDARPGQNEPVYRGDSLHLLSSNIAEGAERNSPAEHTRFLHIAKGSAAELRTQLYIAQRIGVSFYLTKFVNKSFSKRECVGVDRFGPEGDGLDGALLDAVAPSASRFVA